MQLFKKKTVPKQTPNVEHLEDEQRKFEVIVNSIEDGVMLFNADGTIRLCNPGASLITGWPCEEATGIDISQVINLIDAKGNPYEPAANPLTKIFSAGESIQDNKANIINREQRQIALSLRITPLRDKSGAITAAIAVFRDVSEERAEEQKRADFISTASHEMRTPVAAIEGYLSLALNPKVATIDARAQDYLNKAHASTKHLGDLFQDLLTSAKAEDGRLTSHPKVVEIGGFLEQLTNDLRLVAEQKGLFVDFNVGGGSTINATSAPGGDRVVKPLYYAYVDPDRVREVITNLFDNACKYTPEGKITLGLTGNDQVVQCFVRDTGPGIPAEDVPHLFQKFYRVDNSATRTIGGTGLGLFICRKIIELYSGRIWVESEVGKGSSFYINLPRLTNQKAQELQNASEPAVTAPTAAAAVPA